MPDECYGTELRFGAWANTKSYSWLQTARYGTVQGGAVGQVRLIELWGKFGLLNNRLRCLANAIAYGRRVQATILLRGHWEMFVNAVLDVDWLTRSADVVVVESDAWPLSPNSTLSCSDAFACGGPCDRDPRHRAGGQRPRTRSSRLYQQNREPILCGYASLAPRRDARLAATQFAVTNGLKSAVGYHQRLETVVLREPVAKICFASAARISRRYPKVADFYDTVCTGKLKHADLLQAQSSYVPRTAVFLASDRYNRTVFQQWVADGALVYQDSELAFQPDHTFTNAPSAMFKSKLGAALYSSKFIGGSRARRNTLASQVVPVLIDMLLLATTADFWPTPGSTMSETVCFWRKVIGQVYPVRALTSCEEIVVADDT